MTTDRHTPRATYRLQFHSGFTFDDARRLVPYLAALGIGTLYASPILKARAGSTHGYDITDHGTLNPELGGDEAFDRLCATLKDHGLGLLLDMVPNHMGIGQADNAWWLDVLEWGRTSPHAGTFDIDWEPAKRELRHKVLVPTLGAHYGEVLEAGELQLRFAPADGSFSVWYWEHRFPLCPPSYAPLLTAALNGAGDTLSADEGDALQALTAAFRSLRRVPRTARARAARRTRGADLKARLAGLATASPAVAAALAATAERLNGTPGERRSFRPLHRILEAQNYRLAFWRVATDEINYRRFFQINDLAGIRIEVPQVFDAVHRKVLDLVARGCVTGLRIDHIDGLFAPRRYLHRLTDRCRPPLAGDGGGPEMFPLYVEKILGDHEDLREGWPVCGTTGYDFTNDVTQVLVDPAGERALRRAYNRVLGSTAPPFAAVAYDAKRQVMAQELSSELQVLANELNRVTEADWRTRDFTLAELRTALREVVAHFPVYRTYVNTQGATAADERDIDWAVAQARKTRAVVDASIYDFLRSVLTTTWARQPDRRRLLPEVIRIARKFQQYTGPVMAKGVEDTAFYRYNLLVSLNEVGGHPDRFGHGVAAFHRRVAARAQRFPHALLSTATHDTKRGEDTRARITAISEAAAEWSRRVRRWRVLNRRARREIDGRPAPSPNDEYLFYQTLLGVWPEHGDEAGLGELGERLGAYMVKAAREAKVHTSWTDLDAAYEAALCTFVTRVLDTRRANPFLADFGAFAADLLPSGVCNGLSQTVLKLTCPGVPDIYQGADLWDTSLVDPDNRRPVDFARRARLLDDLTRRPPSPALAEELLHAWPDGRLKVWVIHTLLRLRAAWPGLFTTAAYLPLDTEGTRADNVIAFARRGGPEWLIVAVPRMTARLRQDDQVWPLGEAAWARTRITLPDTAPDTPWRNVLTGEDTAPAAPGVLPLSSLLRTLPLAVLRPGDGQAGLRST